MVYVICESPWAVTAQRISQSNLIQVLIVSAAIIVAGAIEAISVPVVILSMGFLIAYGYYISRPLLSEASLGLIQNQTRTDPAAFPWYSQVANGIILSAIPTRERYNARLFKDLGVTTVISAVERTEIIPYFFGSPETPEGWAEQSIQQHFVEAQDYGPLTPEQIHTAVEILRAKIVAGEKVLVHCMAGKGRSVCIVLAYLMKYEGKTLNQALETIRQTRPQAGPSALQQQAVLQYIAAYAS